MRCSRARRRLVAGRLRQRRRARFPERKADAPNAQAWQIVAGKHKRDGSAGGRLLGVDGGEVSAVG